MKEYQIRKFKSPGQAQHFLSIAGPFLNTLSVPRFKHAAEEYRYKLKQAFTLYEHASSSQHVALRKITISFDATMQLNLTVPLIYIIQAAIERTKFLLKKHYSEVYIIRSMESKEKQGIEWIFSPQHD